MSAAMAILGDFNATPGDRGRGTPHWVATAGRLRVHSAGPGRHGDIDYALTDCPTVRADRIPPPSGRSRSDHDVVCFDMANPTDRRDVLMVGTWNVLYGRDPEVVATQVLQVLRVTGLAVLVLQEAADYHQAIGRMAARNKYRVLAYAGQGKGHQVIVVRTELATTRAKLVQLSPAGWDLADGRGEHAPLYAVSWVVEWLRVVDVHFPPSVNWTKRGVPHGPPRRVAAYLYAAVKLVRWARNNRRARP